MQKCFECDYDTAKIRCATCNYNLCVRCNYDKHVWGKKSSQPNQLSTQAPPLRQSKHKVHNFYLACDECEVRPRKTYCTECDEKFCEGCFDVFHKKGKRINHPKRQIDESDKYEILMNVIFYDYKSASYDTVKNLLVDYLVNYKHVIKYIVIYTNDATAFRAKIQEAEFFDIAEILDDNIFTNFATFKQFFDVNFKPTYNINKAHLFFDTTEEYENLFRTDFKDVNLKKFSSFASCEQKDSKVSIDTLTDSDSKFKLQGLPPHKRTSYQSDGNRLDRKRKKDNYNIHKCLSSDNSLASPQDIEARSRLSYFLENSISNFCCKALNKYPLFHIYNDIQFDDPELQTYSLTIQRDLHVMALQGYSKILFDKFILLMQHEHSIPITKLQNIIAKLVDANILYKQVRQFSKYHVLTFLSLKSSFVISHENILWVIKALKKDKVSFTMPMILNKIRDVFDLTLTEDYLYDIFDDYVKYKDREQESNESIFKCMHVTKVGNKKYVIDYMNNDSYMSDFLNDGSKAYSDFDDTLEIVDSDSDFVDFKRFIDATFSMDLLSIKISQPAVVPERKSPAVLTEQKNSSNSNNSIPYSVDSQAKINKSNQKLSDLKGCKTVPNKVVQNMMQSMGQDQITACEQMYESQEKNQIIEKKAIPGGKFGFALFTKYFGTKALKELTIGMILALIDKAIRQNLLKYKKTFIYRSDSQGLHEEDPDFNENKQKLLDRFKTILFELLKENNGQVNVAQAKELIETASSLKMSDFEDYGLLKLKNVLEELSESFKIVEIKRGTSVIVLATASITPKNNNQTRDNDLKKDKKKKIKAKKQESECFSNIVEPQIFINNKPKTESLSLTCNQTRRMSFEDTEFFKKIKITVFKILNASKSGLEPSEIYKAAIQHLKCRFDYIYYGYQSFYDFLVEQFYKIIDIEVRYISKNEAKYIIYLKNKRFGLCKDGKYLLDEDKIEANPKQKQDFKPIEYDQLNPKFLARLLSEQLVDEMENQQTRSKAFSISNMNPCKSPSSLIMYGHNQTNTLSKQHGSKLYALNSLEERVNARNAGLIKPDTYEEQMPDPNAKASFSLRKMHMQSEEVVDSNLLNPLRPDRKLFKYGSESGRSVMKSPVSPSNFSDLSRKPSNIKESILRVIESIESDMDITEIEMDC